MEHRIVRIDAGEHTEELAKFIAQGLSDDELDLIDLERERNEVPGVAQEPITIALIIGAKFAADAGAAAVATAAVVAAGKTNREVDGSSLSHPPVEAGDQDLGN